MSRFFFQNCDRSAWTRPFPKASEEPKGQYNCVLDKWTERNWDCLDFGRKGLRSLEMRPTKEISCWFMCLIRPSRQRTSLALHFELVRLRIWASPPESGFSFSSSVLQAMAWFASKFHGNNAFEDSMAGTVGATEGWNENESDRNGPEESFSLLHQPPHSSVFWEWREDWQNFPISETKSQVTGLLSESRDLCLQREDLAPWL